MERTRETAKAKGRHLRKPLGKTPTTGRIEPESRRAKAGAVVGKRIVKVNDKTYEADITVPKDIDKAGFVKSFFDSIAMFVHWMTGMVLD